MADVEQAQTEEEKYRPCSCGGRFRLNTIDDLATKFYRCEKCGQERSILGTSQEKARLKEGFKRLRHRLDDKPKIKNHCGTCAAFQTPFCTWGYTNFQDKETRRALHVERDAYACCFYFPRRRVEVDSYMKFLKKVERL